MAKDGSMTDLLIKELKTGNAIKPLTFAKSHEFHLSSVINVLDQISLHYPVWNPEPGIFKLITEEDYTNYK